MSSKLETESRVISSGLSASLGFDPISIVTALLPILLNCFNSQETGNAAEFLKDRYDEPTGKFDQHLLERARPAARRAARKAFRAGQSDKKHLSTEQLDEITSQAFKHAMEADDDILQACATEASSINTDAE
jgi:hypothetical protein